MSISCPHCRTQHSSVAALQEHVVLYHPQCRSLDLNFDCCKCRARFLTLKSLNQHLSRSCKASTPVESHNLERVSSSTSSLCDLPGPSVSSFDHNDDLSSEVDPNCIVYSTVHDSNEDEEVTENIVDILQQKVTAFLLHIKDECNASQTIIKEVIKGVDDVIEHYLEWVKDRVVKKFEKTEVLSLQDAVKELDLMKGLSIFQGSQNLLSCLENSGRFVKPQKLVFKSVNVLQSDGSVKMKDEEFAYYVPFTEQLANILSCKDVMNCVQNPKPAPAGTYRSLLDGEFYKTHPITQKHKNPLCFVLHSDGAELTDLGSARVGEHSITNISWCLANIDPELGSTDQTVNLLATVKSKWLNHERMGVLLSDFKDVMVKLASNEGLTLMICGEEMTFHGFLYIVCGDHPAQAFIGGFKETVSATTPCRRCLAARAVYLKQSDISEFVLRSEDSHLHHVAAVEDYIPAKRQRLQAGAVNPSVQFGVNRRSHLMDIPHFPVTSALVQDPMHLFQEGILSHVCRLVISHVVTKKERPLSLEIINDRIKELSQNLRRDRPNCNITEKHLKEGLRQSSSQMRKLSVLLPFVLRQRNGHRFSFAGDKPYEDLLVVMLKVMNLTMAFEQQESDIDKLRKLLIDLHDLILQIDPGINMAKVHFMHHLPEQIKLYGLLRQQACFRFEAHFAFFKRITKISKNFINILLTLSVRHQTRQCHYIMKPYFLYSGHKYGKLKEIPLTVREPDVDILKSLLFTGPLEKIAECSNLIMHSATFTSGKSIILLNSSHLHPKFGKIMKIYVLNGKIGFVCQICKVLCLNPQLHAYEVEQNTSKAYVDVDKLHFRHEILSIKFEGKLMLVPQNHGGLLT